MKTLNTLMQEIIHLTAKIETQYPELYKYLNETPFSVNNSEDESIHSSELQSYLETLKSQLLHHIETHQNNSLKK